VVDRGTLYYAPYPRLTLPAFDPLIGLGLLGLLVPAIVYFFIRGLLFGGREEHLG